jgi:hypothetical protein
MNLHYEVMHIITDSLYDVETAARTYRCCDAAKERTFLKDRELSSNRRFTGFSPLNVQKYASTPPLLPVKRSERSLIQVSRVEFRSGPPLCTAFWHAEGR